MSRWMRATRPAPLTAGISATVGLVLVLGTGATLAAFTGQTANTGNAFAAAPDWLPPTVTGSVVTPVGAEAVPLRPGVSYYVYATVADGGSPPSGVATVAADLSSITLGATSVPLVAGSYTVGGTAYGWRSGAMTADAGLGSGAYGYTHAALDGAGNSSGAQGGFSAVVDATPPTGVDVQGTNTSSGTVGRAEPGDTLTFTYSEPIQPASVRAGWDGSATPVVVRFTRSGGTRTLTVRNAANTAVLPLGTTATGNHAANGATVDYLSSSMAYSSSTITITLGTVSGSPQTSGAFDMSWTPQADVIDLAGNSTSVAAVAEGGVSDADF